MTVWLERSESRFLDLITTSVYGLVKLGSNSIESTKYNFFKAGGSSALFNKINPIILDDIINEFAKNAEGRYTRELAYALLALDFAIDEHARSISTIKLDTFKDIDENKFKQFIQSNKSTYLPTDDAVRFSKLHFASSEWCQTLSNKILEYGYFDRWLDSIDILTKFKLKYFKSDVISFACLKNLIGPFDSRVKGSGPDFVQSTFKSWAFFLDIIDIKTNGKLSNYDMNTKLAYLKKHTGYITEGNGAYRILKNINKAHIIIKRKIPNEIRIIEFMRLVNLEMWRREFNRAIAITLIRTRLLFIINNIIKPTGIEKIFDDDKIKEIAKGLEFEISEKTIFDDLLFLEATGIRLEVMAEDSSSSFTGYILDKLFENYGSNIISDLSNVASKNIFYEKSKNLLNHIDLNKIKIRPLRKFVANKFNMYAPRGKLIEWIKTN